jgi:hypothetical protein
LEAGYRVCSDSGEKQSNHCQHRRVPLDQFPHQLAHPYGNNVGLHYWRVVCRTCKFFVHIFEVVLHHQKVEERKCVAITVSSMNGGIVFIASCVDLGLKELLMQYSKVKLVVRFVLESLSSSERNSTIQDPKFDLGASTGDRSTTSKCTQSSVLPATATMKELPRVWTTP